MSSCAPGPGSRCSTSAKGTVPALTNGLLALPQVRAVNVEERPDDVPGDVRVSVSLNSPPADGSMPAEVLDAIEELRPAGIRILLQKAGQLAIGASVRLVLSGSSLGSVEREQLHETVRRTLVAKVAAVQVGQRVRTGALQAALVDGDRVLDASVTLAPLGGTGDARRRPGARDRAGGRARAGRRGLRAGRVRRSARRTDGGPGGGPRHRATRRARGGPCRRCAAG